MQTIKTATTVSRDPAGVMKYRTHRAKQLNPIRLAWEQIVLPLLASAVCDEITIRF